METADVVVIGGGCNGTSIALHLARRNVGRVVLLERGNLASGGTGRSSALVRQHYNHPALVTMALASLRVFQNFSEKIGGTAEFRTAGFLVTVGSEDVEPLRQNVRMQQEIGVDTRVLSPDDVLSLDSRLNVSDIGAAAFEPQSGYADPYSTTISYGDAARTAGVDIRQNTRVSGLVIKGDQPVEVHTAHGAISAGTVVVAAGYRSRDLLLPLGVDLPVKPVRHPIGIFERPADFGEPHCIVADLIQRSYMRPEGSTLTLVGSSGSERDEPDDAPDADRPVDAADTEKLGQRFAHRFSGIDDFLVHRGYTGVYDVTPDGQPYLGPARGVDGIYLAFGFSGHGFKLSPAVGQILADSICDGESSLVDIDIFRSSRFEENDPIMSHYPYSRPITGSN
jgi:sarcosine oxidase, subunit beta